ncbi:hypothetical protein KY289_013361 [Solanum tuberosum]|nr:hypothetical protein KY289_013361 [Solanum tuberosum]
MDLHLIVDKSKILHIQIDSLKYLRMSCSQGSALRGEFGMNSRLCVRASTWRLLTHTAMKVAEEPTLESNELVVYIAYTLVK